jgi:hypothetical protein
MPKSQLESGGREANVQLNKLRGVLVKSIIAREARAVFSVVFFEDLFAIKPRPGPSVTTA